MDDNGPGTLYGRFNSDEIAHMSAGRRAIWHAKHAEELLAGVKVGIFPAGPPTNVSAAAVHAQLATAWAAICQQGLAE